MRLIQIAVTLQYGDAIGNDMLAIADLAERLGYTSEIYAEHIHSRITDPRAHLLSHLPKLAPDDLLLYHFAIGTPLNTAVLEFPCRRVMIYHNITPPAFFMRHAPAKADICRAGLADAKRLANRFDFCICDSEFNRQDLIAMGYQPEKIAVVPVLVAFDDYKQPHDEAYLQSLRSDDYVNFLFVGRIAPNKRQEAIIRAFAYYKHNISGKARLIITGNPEATPSYYADLVAYIDALHVSDVIFPGHITFAQLLSCYRAADVFVCMSGHEGFCVPLLEAMTFEVPIIALDTTAVGETLGGSGVLLDTDEPVYLARVMHRLATDTAWREEVIARQNARLADFSVEAVQARLTTVLDEITSTAQKQTLPEHREFDALYDLTAARLEAAGAAPGFTRDAFRATAGQQPHSVDVTALLEGSYTNEGFLEAAYLSFFNRLPDAGAYESWRSRFGEEPFAFRRAVVTALSRSPECRDKGMAVLFNPYAASAAPPAAAEATPGLLTRVRRKLGRMLRGQA